MQTYNGYVSIIFKLNHFGRAYADTWKKPYSCYVCDVAFSKNSHLKIRLEKDHVVAKYVALHYLTL